MRRHRHRHRSPAAAPPPIAALLLDGANVIASGSSRAVERLALAIDWCRAAAPALPIEVFCDQSTFGRCPPAAQALLRSWQAGVQPGLQATLCPAGVEADVPLLQRAQAGHGLVLSNDRFFDHAALRSGVLVLQFELVRTRFAPAAEATWFRARGQAVRIATQRLLGSPSPPTDPPLDPRQRVH